MSPFFVARPQAQGLLEAVSSNYRLVDAVATLLPQLASNYECTSFVGELVKLSPPSS